MESANAKTFEFLRSTINDYFRSLNLIGLIEEAQFSWLRLGSGELLRDHL